MQKLTLFLCLILLTKISLSQQDINLSNILPPSPEASAFVKYGTYKVGTHTGKPNISIPIYDIKMNKLSVPISLSYDETGIRVNDMASWVGMNWSLNAGGIISRIVIGQQDGGVPPPRAADIVDNEYYNGYLQTLVDRSTGMPIPDSETDKYYYSFNGRSGHFVFDRNGNVMQIPKTSLKITIFGNGFKIVDESGTVYIFNISENTETYIPSSLGYFPNASVNPMTTTSNYNNPVTSYYLSEIISNDGLEHIYFTYETEDYTTKDEYYSELYGGVWNLLPNLNATTHQHRYSWIGMRRVIHAQRLKKISFVNGKVEFTRLAGRQDDAVASSFLDEISVYRLDGASIYSKAKSFKLSYGYYYNSMSYAENSAWPNESADRYRLRLENVILKNADGVEVSRYGFTYNSTSLPPKTSYSQDWQGYYNGKSTNTTLVPISTVINQGGFPQNIGGADRSSNETYMKAGILEKITYPTGGYTVFETEAHRIPGSTISASESHNAYAHGQSSTNLVVQNFTTPSIVVALSGQISITIGPYGSSDPQPFVKIKNITTGQEQVYTSPDRTNFYSTTISYSFSNNTPYELTASCFANQSNAMAYIYATYNKQIFDPNISTLVGGLRIKSIKNYTYDNALANEEFYKYGQSEDGNGAYVGIGGGAYSYSRALHLYYNSVSQGHGPGHLCSESDATQDVYNQGYLFDPQLVQGSPVVYNEVTKYYGNANENSGKTIYSYGTEPGNPVITTIPLPLGQELANNQGFFIINDSWKGGLLKHIKDFKRENNGTYSLVGETLNGYNIINTDTTYGLIARTKFERVRLGCTIYRFSDFAYAEYPIRSGYVQLAQSTKKTYSQGSSNYLQTVDNYTYDNIHKDIETKVTSFNSKQETIETEKKFPFHKSQLITSITTAESMALDDMVTKNMLFPIEEIQRNNSTQTLLKKTSYEYVNGSTIAPVNIKYQVKSNPIETRLQFTKYDANGNLVEQKKANDIVTSYLWGYGGTAPVVQVVGADYNTVSGMISPSVLSDPNPDPATLRSQLNSIRTGLANPMAQVTTYTYRPLVGISSQTDPNDRTIYYEYDAFNRLKLIRDKDNNILKRVCYNYAGKPEDCTPNCTNNSPNWQNTSTPLRCKLVNNVNTGWQEQEQIDQNPCSPTYGSVQWIQAVYNPTICPPPSGCNTGNCSGDTQKCVNGVCETGVLKIISTRRQKTFPEGPGGPMVWLYFCTSVYCFSDGSTTTPVEYQTSGLCTVQICQ
jgi:hypothetical protein